ncbi:putative cONSERVED TRANSMEMBRANE PROTEIN [Mycobacterium xenopi 4042]|uniref:Putative cONSERVED TRANSMEMBRANE PROTEIN n=1 Tax=Mycobacterium xenopi 4042 TaxID=1299334 RepID=X8CMY5_MYCXE|nr:putative cONSERVED TRANSMEMBRANE PROTEIN [Mycobacterium xenopi 4042]
MDSGASRPPPPPRRRRRPLGPTPRYAAIPRWGLVDRVDLIAGQPSPLQPGPTPAKVRATLLTSIVVLAIAALVYLVRYVLLVINRSTLLNPVVAAAALWLGSWPAWPRWPRSYFALWC